MAVKILMRKKQLEAARAKLAGLRTREAELDAAVEAAAEVSPALEADVLEVATAIDEAEAAVAALVDEIAELEVAEPAADPEPVRSASVPAQRSAAPRMERTRAVETSGFRSRSGCFATRSARDGFYARSNVKDFIGRVRSMVGGQRRGVTGAELTIPTEVLDILRDNLEQYSKLLRHVRLRSVRGNARQQIIGSVPEGVWMEMAGALNELTFAVNEIETDGYKVGGVIVIDNYMLADSDINLGEEVLYMLGQSIGLALDKAIVYGKGGKMPLGIVSRLAETTEPAYWTENRAAWTDLHSANVLKLNLADATGEEFFHTLLAGLAKADPHYAGNTKPVWIMNEATRVELMIKALAFNSAAAIVSGLDYAMPVIGGEIVTLEFMPDHEIAGGYLNAYLLAEREGGQFGYSDLPLYIQDKTVFKGTARYDGQPVRGENFVVVNFANVAPTTDMSFATDYEGDGMNALILTAATDGSGKTKVTVAGAKNGSPKLLYCAKALADGIRVGGTVGSEFKALTSGSTSITATTGTPIVVVELDENDRVISCGSVNAVAGA